MCIRDSYCFSYGAQPPRCDGHLFQLRRTRRKHRSMRVLPNVTAVSQVQATHARRMLCEINYGKYLRGETRSFCINCLNVSDIHLNKQTRFSALQISPYVVQNCDARKSRYQKLKSRAALEGAHEECEFKTLSDDCDWNRAADGMGVWIKRSGSHVRC